jgi:hypothetical protein
MKDESIAFSLERTLALLRDSLATFEYGLERVPGQWLDQRAAPGLWSIARNVAHLAIYEEVLAAPALEDLARGGDGRAVAPGVPRSQAEFDLIESELEARIEEALMRLRSARQRQVAAVESFVEDSFNRASCILWARGPIAAHSPGWVAMKTVQHTWEHGNVVLQAMLFAPRGQTMRPAPSQRLKTGD